MIDYGRVRGSERPKELEITSSSVFVASNIEEYQQVMEDATINGFEYDYIQYTKDEYILKNAEALNQLSDELAAAKILLGVD